MRRRRLRRGFRSRIKRGIRRVRRRRAIRRGTRKLQKIGYRM